MYGCQGVSMCELKRSLRNFLLLEVPTASSNVDAFCVKPQFETPIREEDRSQRKAPTYPTPTVTTMCQKVIESAKPTRARSKKCITRKLQDKKRGRKSPPSDTVNMFRYEHIERCAGRSEPAIVSSDVLENGSAIFILLYKHLLVLF